MSDPRNPVDPAATARPSSVTISSYLLIFFAAVQMLGLILMFTVMADIRDVYRDVYAGTSAPEGMEDIALAAMIGGGVVGLLFAAGLVVLAVLNNRGKNASRIITWVVGGITACCVGVGLTASALGGLVGGESTGDMPSQDEIDRRLSEALPSWYEPVSNTLTVLGLLALLAAMILLALPSSNAFFRKPKAGWEPPAPGTAYPGYPQPYGASGYPYPPYGAPGQPPYGAPGQPPSGNPPAPGESTPPSGPPSSPPYGG